MRRSRKDNSSPEEQANWMTTYSDLVTLLLTFFVLLFSMATIEDKKFEEIKRSLMSTFLHLSNGEQLEVNKGEEIISIVEEVNNPRNNMPNAIDRANNEESTQDNQATKEEQKEIVEAAGRLMEQKAEELKARMQQKINELGLSDYVTVVREEHNVILRIDSVVLFDLGKAEIKESGKLILDNMSSLLTQVENEVLVQGHTDDLPINTVLFPSNWELSTKRATNVVLYLIEHCQIDPVKLTATGSGEYKPIEPNDTPERRQKNRRIDIVLAQDYFEIMERELLENKD